MDGWAKKGCIIFSQYYDTVRYFSEKIASENPGMEIAIYAGSNKSGIWKNEQFIKMKKGIILLLPNMN